MKINKLLLILLTVFIILIINVSSKKQHNNNKGGDGGEFKIKKSRKFVEHTNTIAINRKVWKVSKIESSINAQIELTFGIRQKNLQELEDFVWRVSDPTDSMYGKYKSFNQVIQLVKPMDESIELVQKWLKDNDIKGSKLTASGDFIRVTVSIEKAESLLSVKYNKMVHRITKKSFYRSLDPYTVPDEIVEHIDFIGGVNHLPLLAPKPIYDNDDNNNGNGKSSSKIIKVPKDYNFDNQKHQASRGNDPLMSPELIKKAHGVSLNTTAKSSHLGNSQAIAQFLKEYFSPADLRAFQDRFGLPRQSVESVVGPNENLNPGMETALDIQYILAMAPNVSTWIVSTGGLHEGQEPFLDWLVDLSSNPNLPLVHSISYGDDESSINRPYIDRVDTEFKKYAAMGKTILFSSGDFGVGCNDQCDSFSPGWPASSRFVLAIGGVIQKYDGSIVGDSISGGGFSNHFSRPPYQSEHCDSYINGLNGSLSSYYNQSGRGYPDISSFSENVVITYKGHLLPIGGTSASCPIMAGLISLINDQRLQNGKTPVGFFNPLLYKIAKEYPNTINDINIGENNYKCCSSGFTCKNGWDPVTGLGFISNFDEFIKYCDI